jgi:aspartyl-tRNA(Asn)/glutamyl-tRNA(Gln) amidotransferase subunit B
LWDATTGRTFSMRSKEEAHDYRYFPEPDLPLLAAPAARVDAIRAALPELPLDRRRRLVTAYGLTASDAAALTIARPGLGVYFEETVRAGAEAKSAKNWVLGSVSATMNELGLDDVGRFAERVPAVRLAALLALVDRGTISGSTAKDVFEKMVATGAPAEEIVTAEGLSQIDDETTIVTSIDDVLAKHEDAVAQFRGGKAGALGYLVGQVMKATAGKANPKRVNELLKRRMAEH